MPSTVDVNNGEAHSSSLCCTEAIFLNEDNAIKDLTHKMAQFFGGEDFAERGEDARLELTPAELRQIANLMTENARLKTMLNKHNKALDSIKDTMRLNDGGIMTENRHRQSIIKILSNIMYILAFRAGMITVKEAYIKTGIISESHTYKVAMESEEKYI